MSTPARMTPPFPPSASSLVSFLAILLLTQLLQLNDPTVQCHAAPLPSHISPPTAPTASYPFQNASLPISVRIDNLLSLLTLDEKVSRLYDWEMYPPGVPRLGIPTFEWGQECLRGARNNLQDGNFSAFPVSVGLAASWNVSVFDTMGRVVSDEMRARRNQYHAQGQVGKTYLHCWAPVANVLKDPRWGRAAESYGESPLLIYSYTSHYLAALHDNHPQQIKIAPTVKHFTVYDGPEEGRFSFNAQVSARDLHDTFTVVWRKLMQESPSHIRGVMASYSALNGVPMAANFDLLTKQTRYDWGWETAAVVGDCSAVQNIHDEHHYTSDGVEGAALALVAGVDLDCGGGFASLPEAINRSLITSADIDAALRHSMEVQMRVGFYDVWGDGPFDSISPSVIDSAEHRKAVLDIAHQSAVLLQNNHSVLPLAPSSLKRVAVIGPSAYDVAEYQNCITSSSQCLLSHAYYALTYNIIHPLDGVRDWLHEHGHDAVEVVYARGSERTGTNDTGFADAINAARGSDVIIYVGGLDYTIEIEGIDRHSLELPTIQQLLLQALAALSVPIVSVILHAGAISDDVLVSTSSAILSMGYPSQAGGTAIANILFGSYNPDGRLPYTTYADLSQLPDIGSFHMAALPGRTYAFFTLAPRYYFGDGLSYTTFKYSDLALKVAADGGVAGQVTVANVGPRDGSETIQIYAAYDAQFAGLDVAAELSVPRRLLVAFDKRNIRAGQSIKVTISIPLQRLTAFGRWIQPSLTPSEDARLARHTPLSPSEVRATIDAMRVQRQQLEAERMRWPSGQRLPHSTRSNAGSNVTLPVWFSVGGALPTVERITAGVVLVQCVNVTGPVDDVDVLQTKLGGAAMES